ncbi:uncharacterized protein LOC144911616 isoform X1 [Branchiostoma floridae x Branchiostoma belcheri]
MISLPHWRDQASLPRFVQCAPTPLAGGTAQSRCSGQFTSINQWDPPKIASRANIHKTLNYLSFILSSITAPSARWGRSATPPRAEGAPRKAKINKRGKTFGGGDTAGRSPGQVLPGRPDAAWRSAAQRCCSGDNGKRRSVSTNKFGRSSFTHETTASCWAEGPAFPARSAR